MDKKYKYSFQKKWDICHFLLNIYPKIFIHKIISIDNNKTFQIGFQHKDTLLNVWNSSYYYLLICDLEQLEAIEGEIIDKKYNAYIENTVKELSFKKYK